MLRLTWSALTPEARTAALARPTAQTADGVRQTVAEIFAEIKTGGLTALNAWAQKLDGAPLKTLELTEDVVQAARNVAGAEAIAALDLAVANVRTFHEAENVALGPLVEPMPGVRLQRHYRPIGAVGLYIPGGTAPLFSTLVMTAIPAQVAGVKTRIAVTPPAKNGLLHPMMVAAAAACGLERLHLVGGAQAIAALTYGVGEIQKVDKIFGPGNAYVAEAKAYAASLSQGPAIDLPAGPSELLIIADDSADPGRVAADLLSQAEHDRDAQVILVTTSEALAEAVLAELARQTPLLPRADIAAASLNSGRVILAEDLSQAIEVSNAYAPEHLSLHLADAPSVLPQIRVAGTVFVGENASETFGDYIAGPSHVLPTDGAARAFSGVTVRSFLTSFVAQDMTAAAAQALAGPSARLARLEGLEAHARSADFRRPA